MSGMQCALEISADHPAFAGHFPNFPVLPGAVLIDEVLKIIEQACGIDLTQWHISAAKFLAPVRPRDRLVVEHEAPAEGLIRFSIRLGSRTVASGMLSQRRGNGP
jgi:3-hydroxymyristoyl/3-hydroxydecanoyl-(acyl carrier protein) dehydratase